MGVISSDNNQRLDKGLTVFRPKWQIGHRIRKAGFMGSEFLDWHRAVADVRNHMVKIQGQCIVTADQRRFALVEFRVGKAQVVFDQRRQNIAAAMGPTRQGPRSSR